MSGKTRNLYSFLLLLRFWDCLTKNSISISNNRGRDIQDMDTRGDPNRVGMRGFDPIQITWVDQDRAGTDPAPPDDDELAGLMSLDDEDGNYLCFCVNISFSRRIINRDFLFPSSFDHT